MKRTRKFLALLTALVLMLSFSAVAFAADDGKITITNAVPGQVYKIYRMFDLSMNAEHDAFVYTLSSKWSEFLGYANGGDNVNNYVTENSNHELIWNGEYTEARAAQLALLAKSWLSGKTVAHDGELTAGDVPVVFDNLAYGYYFVTSTLGTVCGLTTTNPHVDIAEKNPVPKMDKQVQEDSDSSWGNENDDDIGQTVHFKAILENLENVESFTYHDTMSDGLTFTSGSVKVKKVSAGQTEADADFVEQDTANYSEVITNVAPDTFRVVFMSDFADSIVPGDKIIIYYDAVINTNAVIAGAGNPNEARLEYKTNGKTSSTPKDTTITYTWQFDVFKYYQKTETSEKKGLEGAEFRLEKDNKFATWTHGEGSNEYKLTGWVTDANDTACKLVSGSNGHFKVIGLDADTYDLEEINAPAGYNIITPNPKSVTLNAAGAGEYVLPTVEVENKTGAELPATGGIGTTIFYVVGAVLMLGAAILLIVRKRMAVAK